MFKIEKNIPLQPVKKRSRPNPTTVFLLGMAKGDSFSTAKKHRTKVYGSIVQAKKHGYSFAVRSLDKDSIRVWRLK